MAIEVVNKILQEGNKDGATKFLIASDLNVQLGLEEGQVGGGRHGQVDRWCLDWNGLLGPDSWGGGENPDAARENMKWLQLMRDYGCETCSTQADKYHEDTCTDLGWKREGPRRQIDYINGSTGVNRGSEYINKERFRVSDRW